MAKRNKLFAACFLLAAPLSQADSLTGIYEKAMKNDPTLGAAEATFKANSEAENLGKSVLLPQVAAGASYSHQDTDLTNVDTNSWNVGFSQTLFDLGKWYNFQSSKELTQAAKAQFASDQQDLIIRTSTTYLNVLRAVANLQTTRAEERAAQRLYEQTKQKYDVGLIAITDVYEAKSQLDSVIAQRIQLEGNVGIAFEQLEVLTGQPEDQVAPLTDNFPIEKPMPNNREAWVQQALNGNFSLQVARLNMGSKQQLAKAQKYNRAPTVSAQAGMGGNDSSYDPNPANLSEAYSDSWSASVSVSLPLYAGGALSATKRQAFENFNAAKEQYTGAQRNVTQQTRSQFLSTITGVATVEARQQAIKSNQASLDATQAGYEVGTRNIVDVLNAQKALYTAQSNYQNARFDYIVSMLKLKDAAGSLTPKDVYRLDKYLDGDNEIVRSKVASY